MILLLVLTLAIHTAIGVLGCTLEVFRLGFGAPSKESVGPNINGLWKFQAPNLHDNTNLEGGIEATGYRGSRGSGWVSGGDTF